MFYYTSFSRHCHQLSLGDRSPKIFLSFVLSLILSYHYKILAGFCLFLLFVNIIKAYTPRSLARNKIFKTIFYISLSRFSLASNSSVHLFWIVNRLFCLTKITSPRKCLNKNKSKHFFYFFSLLQEDLFGTIFRLSLPSLQCMVVKISQIQVKRGFVKESDDFATGSTRNYTRIYRMIYFPCVCVFKFVNLQFDQHVRALKTKTTQSLGKITVVPRVVKKQCNNRVCIQVALNRFITTITKAISRGVLSVCAQCKMKGCPALRGRAIFAWKLTAGTTKNEGEQTRKSSSHCSPSHRHLANLTEANPKKSKMAARPHAKLIFNQRADHDLMCHDFGCTIRVFFIFFF